MTHGAACTHKPRAACAWHETAAVTVRDEHCMPVRGALPMRLTPSRHPDDVVGRRLGKWTEQEHQQLTLGICIYGRDWRRIHRMLLPSRSSEEVRPVVGSRRGASQAQHVVGGVGGAVNVGEHLFRRLRYVSAVRPSPFASHPLSSPLLTHPSSLCCPSPLGGLLREAPLPRAAATRAVHTSRRVPAPLVV